MAAKFYHIFAVEPDTDESLQTPDKMPVYLGQTTNFSMKTEPEKSVDLDDGSRWVGSEKLSLSFSIIGKLQRPIEVLKIWLIPNVGQRVGAAPQGEVLMVDLGNEGLQAKQTQVESKTGEFEMTHFSATRRYPAEVSAVSVFENFFSTCRVHIFPYFPADDYGVLELTLSAGEPLLYTSIQVDGAPIRNHLGGFSFRLTNSARIYLDGVLWKTGYNSVRGVLIEQVPPKGAEEVGEGFEATDEGEMNGGKSLH
jgi:hypothetical protein